MAYQANPYAQYKNSEILTASPGELVLKLYDGTIRFCNLAKVAIEKNNVTEAHVNLMKAERIIDHLTATLDRQYEVAEDFDKLYDYFLATLMEVNMTKDTALLDEMLEKLRMVRDNWKQVMQAATK